MGHVKRFPIHSISIFKERSIKSLRIPHKDDEDTATRAGEFAKKRSQGGEEEDRAER